MGILTQALGLILSLSLLVLLHEFGHFLFAKIFKTRVEKFYLFFNPWFSIFKIKKGETEYGIGWLPLGGYVKISGMIDESMDKEQLKQAPKEYEFRSKTTWQRLLIMVGGVVMNFITALIIYILILYALGKDFIPNKNLSYGVVWDSLAIENGFANGDKIVLVGDKEIVDFDDISKTIVSENPRSITVNRNGENIKIDLPDDFVQQIIARKAIPLVMPAMPFIIDSVIDGMPAHEAGFQKEDKIIAINTSLTPYYTDVFSQMQHFKGATIPVVVDRMGSFDTLTVNVNEEGKIGIAAKMITDLVEIETIHYSFFASIPAGIRYGFETLSHYVKQLKWVFTKEGAKNIGGFGAIGGLFPKSWDWALFWERTAFLSIILAFMNILPIPALDGGHVLFLLFEMITGRKPNDKFLEYAQIAGMLILFTLLIYANGNDIFRMFK